MSSKSTYLPLELLWKYREFKRDEVPAPRVPFYNKYDVDEVTEYVRENGLEPLEFSIVGKKALLTDGNHRIVAAKNLGWIKYLFTSPGMKERVKKPFMNTPLYASGR
jgi:hypothetical protein